MEATGKSPVRMALVLEYDGTQYRGFQYQVQGPTIQQEVEAAIGRFTGEEVRVRGTSRTDSGVHARGQVVDFLTHGDYPAETWVKALNYYLPWDIKVKGANRVPLEFNARRDALSRVYRYTILNSATPSPLLDRWSHWISAPLDEDAMAQAAQCLVGVHDFLTLSAPPARGGHGIRCVNRWDVWREEETVVIEAEANAFLPHQIRRTNGVLAEIGRGRQPISFMQELLEGRVRGPLRCPTLPAKGLCLMQVNYANLQN